MVKLNLLKLTSAKRKKYIKAADPQTNFDSKRNVNVMIDSINKQLDKMKPVTDHVHSVLLKSEVGRKSSVGQHLSYKFKVESLADHQYCEKKTFEENVLGFNFEKEKKIKDKINELLYGQKFLNDVKDLQLNENVTKAILEQEEMDIE